MANITSLLSTIKNAIYGRDMRSALHDGIKAVNDDVETRLSLNGGTMTGGIAMNDNKITSSAVPSNKDDYTNKKYVDDELSKKAHKQTESGGFEGGLEATSFGSGAAIGLSATESGGGAALGEYSTENEGGGAVGSMATVTDGGGAIGYNAETGSGFAGGKNAKTQKSSTENIDAIQLGTGTNSVEKSLQVYDHILMNPDGSIPKERLSLAPKTEVVDSLTSHDATKALSALQGNKLERSKISYDRAYSGESGYLDNLVPEADTSYNTTDKWYYITTRFSNVMGFINEYLYARNMRPMPPDGIDEYNDALQIMIMGEDICKRVRTCHKDSNGSLTYTWSEWCPYLTGAAIEGKADIDDIPTKMSELQNDSGYAKEANRVYCMSSEYIDISELPNNDQRIYGEVSSINVAFPDNLSADYISCMIFSTPNVIPENYTTFPSALYFKGDECNGGIFVPNTLTRYTMLFYHDGVKLIGLVSGIEVVV